MSGGARLVFRRRQNALLAAASLAALATPNHLRVNPNRRGSRPRAIGHPIHDGGRHIGQEGRGSEAQATHEPVRRLRFEALDAEERLPALWVVVAALAPISRTLVALATAPRESWAHS